MKAHHFNVTSRATWTLVASVANSITPSVFLCHLSRNSLLHLSQHHSSSPPCQKSIPNSYEPTKEYGSEQKALNPLYIQDYMCYCPKLISAPSEALLFLSPNDPHQSLRNNIPCRPFSPASSRLAYQPNWTYTTIISLTVCTVVEDDQHLCPPPCICNTSCTNSLSFPKGFHRQNYSSSS